MVSTRLVEKESRRVRGQIAGLQTMLVAVMTVILIAAMFAILLGYFQETVVPRLGLNTTAPRVESVTTTGFDIIDIAVALLIVLVIAGFFYLIIRFLSARE